MGTFAYYLVAAMIELDPPSKWEDIVDQALFEMNCSTARRKYCAEQLEKALEVALRFGTIKRMNDKYYLYEYGLVSPEGNVTYNLEKLANQLGEDSDELNELLLLPSISSLAMMKASQLTERVRSNHELQETGSSLVGPLTRGFLETYAARMDDSQGGSGIRASDDSELEENSSAAFIECLNRKYMSAPEIGAKQSSSEE